MRENFCITSLVVGEKYRKFSKLFYDSWIEKCEVDRPKLILVVDDLDYYKDFDHPDFTAVPLTKETYGHIDSNKTVGTGTVYKFDYSLKRFCFQACLDRGHENICFIDMDMIIRVWDWDVINKCEHEGLWCGSWYPASGFGGEIPKKEEDVTFTPKLEALKNEMDLSFNWVDFKMPFEAALVLTSTKEKIQNFINNWALVSESTRKLGLQMENVCHEISIAAELSEIKQGLNRELLSVIFRHYIMSHKELLDIYKSKYVDEKAGEGKKPSPTPRNIFSKCPFRSPEAVSHAIKDIIRDKTVCELGCAEGDNMVFLSRYAKKVFGFDNKEERYEVAKKRGLDIRALDYRNEDVPLAEVYYFWPDEGYKDNDYLIRKLISNKDFKGVIVVAADSGHTGIRLGGPHRAESMVVRQCADYWGGEIITVPFNEGDGYRESGEFILAVIKSGPALNSLVLNGLK